MHARGCLSVYSGGGDSGTLPGRSGRCLGLSFTLIMGEAIETLNLFSQLSSIARHSIERKKNERKKNRWSQLRKEKINNYLMGRWGRDSWEKMLFPISVFRSAKLRGGVEP